MELCGVPIAGIPAARTMKHIFGFIKKAVLWSYERNTWQWDVLCVLILVFIFLSPKTWFTNSERRARWGHQSEAVSTVLVGAELIDNGDNKQLEQRVRVLSGQASAQVVAVRVRRDGSGKTIAYEVDIR
jgi:hypothetical protein